MWCATARRIEDSFPEVLRPNDGSVSERQGRADEIGNLFGRDALVDGESETTVGGIKVCKRVGQVVEGTAQDLDIIGTHQVQRQRSAAGKVFEVLAEILASGSTTFLVHHSSEEAFERQVGAVNNSHTATGSLGQRDDMAEERGTVTVEVLEDHVDGIAHVLGWSAFGAALSQRGGQLLDAPLDILQFGEFIRRSALRRVVGVSFNA